MSVGYDNKEWVKVTSNGQDELGCPAKERVEGTAQIEIPENAELSYSGKYLKLTHSLECYVRHKDEKDGKTVTVPINIYKPIYEEEMRKQAS